MTLSCVRRLAEETPSIRATWIKRNLLSLNRPDAPTLSRWMGLLMHEHRGRSCWATLFPHPCGIELAWGGDGSQPLVIQNGAVCRFEWRAQCLGGARLWLHCPTCDRRVGRIFFVDRRPACRVCHEIAYDTQRVTACWRAANRAQQRRKCLGGSMNLFEPFPPRPKWMRWRRYRHLEQRERVDLALHFATAPLIGPPVRPLLTASASMAD
jgi:hypothetical protein